jgi:integrase
MRNGTVRRLASGRFQARYFVDGQMHSADRTFATRTEASDWLAQRRVDLRAGIRTDSRAGQARIGDLTRSWIDANASRLKPKTVTTYRNVCESLVCRPSEGIGTMSIRDIRYSDLQAWVGRMGQAGRSPSRARQGLRLVSQVLDTARRDGIIAVNPSSDVRLPRMPAPRHTILQPAQIAALRREMPVELRALIDVLAWGGLRLGEATALQRRALDLDAKLLHVDRAHTEAHDENGNFTKIEGLPKSHQVRTVRLTDATVEALREHMQRYAGPDGTDYVFAGRRGGPLWNGPLRRRWDRAVERAGIPRVTPHDMRATCISLLISAGADPTSVQHHVGHADAGVTMRVYSQVNQRGDERLAAVLSELQRDDSELGTELGTEPEPTPAYGGPQAPDLGLHPSPPS